LLQRACSADQASLSRPMVVADSPPASLPSSAASASSNSPVDPLEVEDRDQHLEALRPARVGRQNRRREADALQAFANAITHARAAHSDRADAGHDLPLGQMPVTDQPLAAVLGQLVSMTGEQGCSLGLDCLGQQRSRAVAQHRGQRISKSSWLGELENVSFGHGVSLLRWRSGASNTPRYAALPPYAVTNFRP